MVLRVLSPEYGKIAVFVRGARNSKRRFAGSLEIFDRGRFHFKRSLSLKKSSSLFVLESFDPAGAAHGIRSDFLKLTMASLLCEAFDLIIKEGQDASAVSEQYFESFTLAIEAIDQSSAPGDILRACYIGLKTLMHLAGFLDRDQMEIANMKNLKALLSEIENCAERRLLSRSEFELIFKNPASKTG